ATVPDGGVMVANGEEEREIRAELFVDNGEGGVGVSLLVEVALVDHHFGAFRKEQVKHLREVLIKPGITDEGDFDLAGCLLISRLAINSVCLTISRCTGGEQHRRKNKQTYKGKMKHPP